MLTVDMLRHGALQGGVKYRGRVEGLLTQEGWAQMERVWQQVNDVVDLIITSPLLRCAEPAQAWAQQKAIPCLMDERIAEMHYGAWEDKSHEEIEIEWPGMLEKWRANPEGMRPPGGESPEELHARVVDFWRDITTRYAGKHLLVVAHSGSTRMLIAHIQGKPIAYTREIEMPYACWSRASGMAGKSRMLFVNQSPIDREGDGE